jgi:hypothetical protein
LGNRSDEVVALKVGLTQNFFDQANLPPEFTNLRRRAISNAYLRCIEFILKDSRPKEELRHKIVEAFCQAVRSDPTNLLTAALRLRSALKRLSRKFSNRAPKRNRKSRNSSLIINPAANLSGGGSSQLQKIPAGPGSDS